MTDGGILTRHDHVATALRLHGGVAKVRLAGYCIKGGWLRFYGFEIPFHVGPIKMKIIRRSPGSVLV